MVTKSKTTSKTLSYLLEGKIGQGFYLELTEDIKNGRGESFKDSLRRYLVYFAESISSSVISPKLTSSDFLDILSYLCFYIGQYPELFGRMKAFFEDEDFYSFNVGIKLFNDFIERMSLALDEKGLTKFYLRMSVNDSIKPVVDKTTLFGMDVSFSSPSIGKLLNPKTVSTKVTIYIKNIIDRKTVFSLTLFDYINNSKSSPIVLTSSEGKLIKTLSLEIPYESLLPNGLANIGLEVECKTHVVDSSLKKKKVTLEYGKVKLSIKPHLRLVK